MISLFSNKNIKEAHATIKRLEGEAVERNKQIEDLKKQILDIPVPHKEYEAKIESLNKEHAVKVESIIKEHACKVQELEQSLEAAKKVTTEAVMKQASLKVEAIGIKEEETFKPSVSSEVAYEAVLTKLQSLPRGSKERADYFKKNEGLLTLPDNSLTQQETE